MDNQKNLLLAVIFSIAVLVGYDFFFAPKKEFQSNINDLNNDTLSEKQGPESEAPSISEKLSSKSTNSSFNEKRVSFKSKRLEGSINLYGATIDEIIQYEKQDLTIFPIYLLRMALERVQKQ